MKLLSEEPKATSSVHEYVCKGVPWGDRRRQVFSYQHRCLQCPIQIPRVSTNRSVFLRLKAEMFPQVPATLFSKGALLCLQQEPTQLDFAFNGPGLLEDQES